MATGPKIVHKQFNSPIGLYSQHNIQETLNKHLQNLDNGTVGIDFSNPTTDKPTNLANSAVLRMLEEEERNRRGYPKLDPTQVQAILETMVHSNHRFDRYWPPERAKMASARSWDGQLNNTGHIHSEFMKATKGQKKVVWPPVPETNGYHSPQNQQRQQSPTYHNTAAHPPSHQPPQPAPQSPQYQQHHQPYPQSQQNQHNQSNSAFCEGRRQAACGLSRLIPAGPGVTARPVSPAPFHQGPQSPGVAPQPYRPPQGRWAPVPSPHSPQAYGAQPNYQQQHSPQPQYSPQQQQYSPQQQQYSPQPQQHSPQQQQNLQYPQSQQHALQQQQQQYSQQYAQQQQQHPPQPQYDYQPPQKQFEPPPTTITLRQQTPIHQKPSPVFASQPAAASYKEQSPSPGGVNMRGDQKWPPQPVREAVAAENEARRQLAKGPACRPRRVRKDYSSFFAQNALNNNYPGYRAPPGTQHYEENSGRSSY